MLKYGDPGYMEEDRRHELYAITFSVLSIAIIVVFLRLFSRWYLVRARSCTLSEILILVSISVDIGSCVLIHFQIDTGMGKHIEYSRERPAMLQASMKVGLAQNVTYQALIGLIKTSILAQYHLLAPLGTPKRVVLGTTIFVVIWTLFTTFAAIFQCIPMNAAWNLDTFPKGCWNMMEMNYFTSAMNTFLDIVIFIMPLRTIFELQMDRKKKVALFVGFSVGLLAIACSVIRLRNIAYFRGVGDFTYEAAMVPIWGAIECNSGIVCASFPHTVPLFRTIGGSVFRTLTGSRGDTTPGTGYELRQHNSRSWPLNSRRQSQWQHMPSESTEKIAREQVEDVSVRDCHEETRSIQQV